MREWGRGGKVDCRGEDEEMKKGWEMIGRDEGMGKRRKGRLQGGG